MRERAIITIFLCASLTQACGGEPGITGATEPQPTTTAGAETESEEPLADEEPEAAIEPPPPASGPSSITVEATVNGEALGAKVRLVGADGGLAAEGTAGQKLLVTSGSYSLEVEVTDAAKLVDTPTEKREITLAPGGDIVESVKFPFARITLNVRVNGTLNKSAVVRILRQGAQVAEFKSAADPVAISPGRYQAEVKVKGALIKVPELMFPQGATRAMPVSVAM